MIILVPLRSNISLDYNDRTMHSAQPHLDVGCTEKKLSVTGYTHHTNLQ
jgi:hypothetical protein